VTITSASANRLGPDILLPIEEVDLDSPSEQVRVRTLSAPDVAALPRFTGLPIEMDFERRLRSRFAEPDRARRL
jgi:hypothetical protein